MPSPHLTSQYYYIEVSLEGSSRYPPKANVDHLLLDCHLLATYYTQTPHPGEEDISELSVTMSTLHCHSLQHGPVRQR